MSGSGGSHISGADWLPVGQIPEQTPNALYDDALRGALTLVRANGGEIATLDNARTVLVSRSRQSYPRLDPALAQAAPASRPRRESVASTNESDIETQPTRVLPSSHAMQTYKLGEGLIGHVAQDGMPVIIRADEYREQFRGARDVEGQWYLAVPIFRPGDLSALRSTQGVLGVIVVYNRDPHWSFTQRDIELLALHADRLAQRMMNEELRRSVRIQSVLIDLLRGAEESDASAPAIYRRVEDAVDRTINPSAFALIRLSASGREATFEIARREGSRFDRITRNVVDLPAWWRAWVEKGKAVRRGAEDERRMYPEEFALGWGGSTHAQSLIATPMTHGSKFIGALVVGSPHPNAFTQEQQGALEAIARTTAALLENARLAEETQRSYEAVAAKAEQLATLNNAVLAKADQLAALNNAILALNATLNLDATAEALAKHAAHLTSATAAMVLLLEADPPRFVAHAMDHRAPATHTSLPLSEITIPVGWRDIQARLAHEPFVLLDREQLKREANTTFDHFLREQDVRSCLIAPIIRQETPSSAAQQNTVGILMAYRPGHDSPFDPHEASQEITQLQGLAAQAGSAIDNAILYADLAAALERQKELDRLKDEFILTIAHEFRTPLTTIEGYGSLFGKHGDRLDVEKAKRFADEIHRATVQLNSMISMLSDANRLSAQELPVTIKPVRALDAIEQAVYNQGSQARARISVEAPSDIVVLADPERLPTVFSNLLSNAIKYAEHGPITVRAQGESRSALARAKLRAPSQPDAPDRWVVMAVQDTGPGIPREDQDKLFQKFVRLSRSLTTPVRGTGLGLWICAEYVHAMGGEIWVESELGKGARFAFCLPAAR
jgi:signal transduction histidine kinase